MFRYLAPAAAVAALSMGAAPAPAQTPFEGVITFRMTEPNGKQTEVIQTTKGRKFRLDGIGESKRGPGVAMIVDADADRMVMLMPADKRAMVMTKADMEQMAEMAKGMGVDAEVETGGKPELDFARTGRTETVAGVRCEVWAGAFADKDKRREGEVCLADGVGFALLDAMASNPMLGRGVSNELARYHRLVGPNKGILKVTALENGTRKVQLEATRIERKAVDNATFATPEGYTEVNMGQMMQGMMKGQQGGKP
ncbi:MAG: DUF4412 domain-containing protein [Gemmatimonadales bacterium]